MIPSVFSVLIFIPPGMPLSYVSVKFTICQMLHASITAIWSTLLYVLSHPQLTEPLSSPFNRTTGIPWLLLGNPLTPMLPQPMPLLIRVGGHASPPCTSKLVCILYRLVSLSIPLRDVCRDCVVTRRPWFGPRLVGTNDHVLLT